MADEKPKVDRASQTWLAVKGRASAELRSARAMLEVQGLDATTTEHCRGRIEAYKNILRLDPGQDVGPTADHADEA